MKFTWKRPNELEEKEYTVTNSLSFRKYITDLLDPTKKLELTKRNAMKPSKLILFSILAQYLKENNAQEDYKLAIEKLAQDKKLPSSFCESKEFKDYFEQIDRCFNLDFNPTSSVIGALVSQEIVKVITKKDNPGAGLFIYDTQSQTCCLELI